MPIALSDNHPERFNLVNELHARPFPYLIAPSNGAFIAFKVPKATQNKGISVEQEHLLALLNRYGAPLPADNTNHYYGPIGQAQLRWERHNEFVTYALYHNIEASKPFDEDLFNLFPSDWIRSAPGKVLTSALIQITSAVNQNTAKTSQHASVDKHFVEESLAMSAILDEQATVCSDFRIDPFGHVRLMVIATESLNERRLGRVVQQLIEIETYKTMAMLALPKARIVAKRVSELDTQLAELVQSMSISHDSHSQTLDQLLKISAEIEFLVSESAFRFGAADAYETIVNQRIDALRETRLEGRQMISEFMLRRFDPAMRTCRSAQLRLMDLSGRAARASNLLRTRVDVATSAQNQKVLESMNTRAELQLRLQETVEGLSVVAISYYAVNLLAYLLTPVGKMIGMDAKLITALLIIPVIACVIAVTKHIKHNIHNGD